MIIPTIHLNGTSKKELVQQLRTASVACSELEKALVAAAPHGRDYYPQGSDALTQAAEAHSKRIQSAHAIRAELLAIYQGIEDQSSPVKDKPTGGDLDWIKR